MSLISSTSWCFPKQVSPYPHQRTADFASLHLRLSDPVYCTSCCVAKIFCCHSLRVSSLRHPWCCFARHQSLFVRFSVFLLTLVAGAWNVTSSTVLFISSSADLPVAPASVKAMITLKVRTACFFTLNDCAIGSCSVKFHANLLLRRLCLRTPAPAPLMLARSVLAFLLHVEPNHLTPTLALCQIPDPCDLGLVPHHQA